ncbi:hypothetical protein ABTP12_18205, partial [Acinetobacter baumannii]
MGGLLRRLGVPHPGTPPLPQSLGGAAGPGPGSPGVAPGPGPPVPPPSLPAAGSRPPGLLRLPPYGP